MELRTEIFVHKCAQSDSRRLQGEKDSLVEQPRVSQEFFSRTIVPLSLLRNKFSRGAYQIRKINEILFYNVCSLEVKSTVTTICKIVLKNKKIPVNLSVILLENHKFTNYSEKRNFYVLLFRTKAPHCNCL